MEKKKHLDGVAFFLSCKGMHWSISFRYAESSLTMCMWALAIQGQPLALEVEQTWGLEVWTGVTAVTQAPQLWCWLISAHLKLQVEITGISLQISCGTSWLSPRGSFPVNFDANYWSPESMKV